MAGNVHVVAVRLRLMSIRDGRSGGPPRRLLAGDVHRIRRIDAAGRIASVAGGCLASGSVTVVPARDACLRIKDMPSIPGAGSMSPRSGGSHVSIRIAGLTRKRYRP